MNVTALRLGDRVAVVNGDQLAEPLTVGTIEPRRVRLVPSRDSAVEWWLYEDQHQVEIVREEAPEAQPLAPVRQDDRAPAKPKRRVSKVVEGIRLYSTGGSQWESEDGRYGVQLEEGITFCDAEHPVRLTRSMIEQAEANRGKPWAKEILDAHGMGRKGYLCPGMVEHPNPIWTAWSGDEVASDIGNTFAAALDILAEAIRREAS